VQHNFWTISNSRIESLEDTMHEIDDLLHGIKSRRESSRYSVALARDLGLLCSEYDSLMITPAGKKILEGGNVAKAQLRHQLLRYQLPHPSQERQTHDSFEIFPFRFMLKLLLNPKIRYLLSGEMALFVINTKKNSELSKVEHHINTYRAKRRTDFAPLGWRTELIESSKSLRDKLRSRHNMESHWSYISSRGLLFMHHLEIFEGIIFENSREFGGPEKQISIKADNVAELKKSIFKYDRSFPAIHGDDAEAFIESYGQACG